MLLDINEEIVQFAQIAFKHGIKKGFFINKELIKQYCSLFESSRMSLLDSTYNDTETSSIYGISISTISGKRYCMYLSNELESNEWIDSLESNKYLTIYRKLEDTETMIIQSNNQINNQLNDISNYEKSKISSNNLINELKDSIDKQNSKIKQLESELFSIKSHLKTVENERLSLLQSKGIQPKTLPVWADSRSTLKSNSIDVIKIWIGTWNLGANDPFVGVDRDRAHRQLSPYISPGYDIYVLGIQEGISDSIYECIEGILAPEGYYRLQLQEDGSNQSNGIIDNSRLYGRGDNSLLSQKFTGIGVFIHRKLRNDIKLLAVSQVPFTNVHSKGGIGVAISILGRTIVFINSYFESKKNDIRRLQYKKIITALGEKLGENSFNLNEQFHHILWTGDFNYKLVDINDSNNLQLNNDMIPLPSDIAIKMLENGNNKQLFESYDQLRIERKNSYIFYGFREPTPFPNFYPTYKKYENRLPVDYNNKQWVRECYKTKYNEPFYKGGFSKERTPGYTDRVLYHSMVDVSEDLIPECIPQKLNILLTNESNNNDKIDSIVALIDNYQSMNDGEIFSISDHSPVFATFTLRLTHNYDSLKQEILDRNGNSKGSIQDVLNALSQANNQNFESKSQLNQLINQSNDKSTNDDSNLFTSSLLPPGIRRIKLYDIRLLWGASEISPSYVKVLFPAPYESIAGEKFVDLSCSDEIIDDTFKYRLDSPIKSTPSSPSKSSRIGSYRSQSILSNSSIDSYNPEKLAGIWRKANSSKTGSCYIAEYHLGSNTDSKIPSVEFTWRGAEPLDKLHICLQIQMITTSLYNNRKEDDADVLTGNCAIGLEQLCKIALVSTGGVHGTASITRILLKEGLPLYTIDKRTMQREQVTLCCKVDLLPSIVSYDN